MSARYLHTIRADCPLPAGTPVVGYARDSGADAQERSVDQQIEAIREYCAAHGLALEHVYADRARPGSSAEHRDAFNAMLADIRARLPQVRNRHKRQANRLGIVVWKPNRISRDLVETAHVRSDMRLRGVTIVALVAGAETGNTALDSVLETIQALQDQQLTDEISQNAKRGLAQLVSLRDTDAAFRAYNPDWPTADGRYLGIRPGTVPVGFASEQVIIGVDRRGAPRVAQRIYPDPAQASTIRRAFQLRRSGASIGDIEAATGIGSRALYTNLLYAGVLEYGGHVYDGWCEPMVPREWVDSEREAAAARSAMRRGVTVPADLHPRRVSSTHLLTNLCECACGQLAFADTSNGLRYYRCASKGACGQPRVRADRLEDAIKQHLLDAVLTVENMKTLAVNIARALATETAGLEAEVDALERQEAEIARAIDGLLLMAERGGDVGAISKRLDTRAVEQRALAVKLGRARQKLAEAGTVKLPTEAEIMRWRENIRAALYDGPAGVVRNAMRVLVHKVVLTGKRGATVYVRQFPAILGLSVGAPYGAASMPKGHRIFLRRAG